ncbi:hypothetical protein Pyrfu_1835 [Pyrolobus fumarii 1A]|uniref:Uncharacterized protein n=1 Tax=Pyrolobus fumarii (strain DSM 11204 / 1A) TaxID=694429 RepID=G0ECW9_PYRF1|nr:hypothetical protein Pyrfu_1835 [Pyrolobus fumarii 1A]
MAAVIFLDTSILYHILHKTPRMEEVLTLLEENPETIPSIIQFTMR